MLSYSRSRVLRLLLRCRGTAEVSSAGCHSATSSTHTVDKDEVHRFSQLSSKWWDEKGEYAALHTMNRLRIPLIKQAFTSLADDTPTPLAGITILDVGCGGGLLSEPLCRLGATVTGLDATESNVTAAEERKVSLKEPQLDSNLSYLCETIENYAADRENTYDLVVASEVVEHISSLDTFIKSCVHLVKPGGGIVITTLNKTSIAYWLAIYAAENIAGLVPKGTHDWEKFVEPAKLKQLLEKYGCRQTLLHGMCLNPVTLQWSWTENADINYATRFVKQPDATG